MSDIVIEAPLIVALPVAWTGAGSPVRPVSSIGRDSAARLVEIGHDPDREPPIVLQKNPNDVDTYGQSPARPRFKDVHRSTKIPDARKPGGTSFSREPASDHVYGDGCRIIRI